MKGINMSNSRSSLELIKRPAGELIIEAADLALDDILEGIVNDSDLFEKLPIIKWAYLGRNIANNIHLSFFIKKYSAFIGPISKEGDFWDDPKLGDLLKNEKKFNSIVDETLIALDRYQAVNKAKLLGILFVKTFKNGIFSIAEYNTLLFSIELMHPYLGLSCLKDFYEYRVKMIETSDDEKRREVWSEGSKIEFSPLASTTLLKLPAGGVFAGDLGGAFISSLGIKFYEAVAREVV
jgi:hypothetical protein